MKAVAKDVLQQCVLKKEWRDCWSVDRWVTGVYCWRNWGISQPTSAIPEYMWHNCGPAQTESFFPCYASIWVLSCCSEKTCHKCLALTQSGKV